MCSKKKKKRSTNGKVFVDVRRAVDALFIMSLFTTFSKGHFLKGHIFAF